MAVSIQGVDWSYDPPTTAQLVAAGKQFAARYVSTPGHQKNLTAPEARGLQAAGLDIVVVGEISANRALGGFNQGKADMTSWRAQVRDLGGPDPCPIYMAVDFDVLAAPAGVRGFTLGHKELRAMMADLPGRAAQGDPMALGNLGKAGVRVQNFRAALRASQMDLVIGYIQGGAAVNGQRYTGPYGERDVIDANHAVAAGFYGWQTLAWSGGTWSTWAQLRQYRLEVPLGSGTVDLDVAVATDYGQWGGQGLEWWQRRLTDAELAQLADGFVRALQ